MTDRLDYAAIAARLDQAFAWSVHWKSKGDAVWDIWLELPDATAEVIEVGREALSAVELITTLRDDAAALLARVRELEER